MSTNRWIRFRKLLPALALAALVPVACAEPAADPEPGVPPAEGTAAHAPHEIWAMDQGTHRLYIYTPELEVADVVDLEPHGVRVPHMIHFTSDHAYAFVAGVGSGHTAVIRAEDRAVVAVVETGPRTHMATVAPDDQRVLVAVIGSPDTPWDGRIVELTGEAAPASWAVGRSLTVAQDPLFQARIDEFVDSGPVCSYFTDDGRYAYVTLGPNLEAGGVVVLDLESFTLAAVHPPGDVPANCGTLLAPGGHHMIVNAGSAEDGHWFAFDVSAHEVIHQDGSRGIDAHGVWATPDGREIWMVNRVTDNAIVIDPETLEIVDEIEFVGVTPDIIAMAPDGSRAYITLRGPNPVTMPHVAVGETPGFSVVDVASREILHVVQPDEGNPASDFHGIAVRVLHQE